MSSGQKQTPNTIPSGFRRVPKFKVGQKVWSKQGNVEYEVIEQQGVNSWGIPEYLVQDVMSKAETYHMEDWLTGEPFYKPECGCGAKYTGFPDAHMFFCPAYKEGSR